MASGPVVVNATTNASVCSGIDTFAVNGAIGFNGQLNCLSGGVSRSSTARRWASTGAPNAFRIDVSGDVGIGALTFDTSAARVLALGNATAPSTSPAGMGQIYVEAGALKYRGSGGTITTLASA